MTSRPVGYSLAVALIMAVAAGLLWFSAMDKSATFDEPVYLAAGHSYLATGDFRINPEHPALLKAWMALALLPAGLDSHIDYAGWTNTWPIQYGRRFVYDNVLDPASILLRGRAMIMILALVTCWMVHRMSARLYGPGAGLVSLALAALCPNLIAHGRLATLDAGLACFMMIALAELFAYLRAPSGGRIAMLVTATFLLLQTKYNSMLFLPVAAAAIVWKTPENGIRQFKPALIWIGAVLLLCLFTQPTNPGLDYFRGLKLALFERASLMNQDFPSFLLGRYSTDGFWYYHLICFLLKTPLPILILTVLLGCSLLASLPTPVGKGCPRSAGTGEGTNLMQVRRKPVTFEEAILVATALIWIGHTLFVRQNVGVRYILPVYPILYVLAGRVARNWLSSRRMKIALTALLIWLAAGTVKTFPHYLTYFNAFAGGPDGGIRYLSESNVDWGQDLAGLGTYVREHRIEKLYLYYYGIEPPEIHGIAYAPISHEQILNPTPGIYAVSATVLRAPWVDDARRVRFDWLDKYKPIAIIGHSIYVYDFY